MAKMSRHFWDHGELEVGLTMKLSWYALYNLISYTVQYSLIFPSIPERGKFECAGIYNRTISLMLKNKIKLKLSK